MRAALALLALAVALGVAASASAADPVFSGYETRVTSDPGDQYDPAIAGDLVVFTDYRTIDTDVYYTDLATMTEHPVVVAPGNQELTGVSAGVVVYTDYRTTDVVAYDTATGTAQNLTAPDKAAAGRVFSSVDPAIDQGLVAWTDYRDGNQEIYAKLLATGEERRITDSPAADQRPSVSGTTIVWQSCGTTCDIWAYDWATQATTQVTSTPTCNERSPNVDGSTVVYYGDCTGDNDLYAYDLATGTTHHLALAGDQANPHASGDFVSFDDLSQGLYHIKLWHIPTGDVFQVTSGTAGQYLNDIDGNRVVYTDDRNGDLEIYMFTFTVDWPQSDTTPPAVTVPAGVAVDATTPQGGTATWGASATDDVDGALPATCDPSSGSFFTQVDTTVTCSATDAAGNTGTASFVVHVRFAPEQLASLRAEVTSLGLRPLLNLTLQGELAGAQAALRAGRPALACAALTLFGVEVHAAAGHGLDASAAADLLAAATRIRAVIGC